MSEPNYLYRYQRLPDKNNPNEKDWLHNLFVENKLWFSSPKDFNDPFDCDLNIRFLWSADEVNILKEKILKPYSNEDDFDVINLLGFKNERYRTIISNSFCQMFNQLHEQYKYGMLCLSEAYDDILMWSHYADKHKGYCLKFDVSVMKTKWHGNYSFPVKYNQNLPTALEIFGNTGNGESLKKMLTWKAKHWDYEKEHRIVYPNTARQNIPFPPEMLTGIIFSCEMKDKERQEIENLVKSNPKLGHVRFHEAKKKPNEFGLDIVQL